MIRPLVTGAPFTSTDVTAIANDDLVLQGRRHLGPDGIFSDGFDSNYERHR